MGKNENTSESRQATTQQLDQIATLAAAMGFPGRCVRVPNETAMAAATQYAMIKGVLRTHSERIPSASPGGTATNTGS